jgi:hypothetical protein
MTLYSYRREFHLTYFDRSTLPKNNSLSEKGETGTEHALYLTLEKVVKPSEMGYSWSRDLHGLPQPVVLFNLLYAEYYHASMGTLVSEMSP